MIQRRAGSAVAVIFSARERVFRGERILLSIDRRTGVTLSVTHCAEAQPPAENIAARKEVSL